MTEQSRRVVEIYTDGLAQQSRARGWAAVLLYQDKIKEIWGSEPQTTNQRMELKAVVEG